MIAMIYRESAEELARAAVDVLVAEVAKILDEKEFVVLAIPGGRSVQGIWNILGSELRIPWKRVHIFMADERVVQPTDTESNYKLAHDMFLGQLIGSGALPKENVHPFIPKNTADRGSGSYYDELKRFGGKPDILILGSGEDGHITALYPNHPSIKSEADGYIFMGDSPKPPPERIAMSRKILLAAKVALLLFIGEGKREAYERFRSGNSAVECPARLVKRIENAYVLTNLK